MNNSEKITDLILSAIEKFTESWAIKKRKEFLNGLGKYDKDSDTILYYDKGESRPSLPDDYFLDEGGINPDYENFIFEESQQYENIYEFTFDEYCSSYLPICEHTAWGSKSIDDSYEFNIDSEAYSLVLEIKSVFGKISDPIYLYKISQEFGEIFNNLINNKIVSCSNKDQKSILVGFQKRVNYYLNSKFENEKEVYEINKHYTDFLDFNITQEELISLMYILYSSDMFNANESPKSDFKNFTSKYFRYKKGNEYVCIGNRKWVSNKFSDILSGNGGKGVEKVKKRLLSVLNNL